MKVLILSKEGYGLGVAHRLATDGHDVSMYIERKEYKNAGVGLMKRVESWRPYFRGSDLIICDMVGFGKYEKLFKESGKNALGCSAVLDILELDRARGIKAFKSVGVDIPTTHEYSTPREALSLLPMWVDGGFFVKPSGNQSTSKTQRIDDPAVYEWFLSTLSGPIIVQEVAPGIEVSTEGWFNGRDWVTPFNHTFEEKLLFPNGGPNTGCMGNVVITSQSNRLTRNTVEKMTDKLRKINYRGPVDINAMVDNKHARALEFTSRLGYDAIESLLEGLKEPAFDLFFETALGVKKEMDITNDFMIAVRMSSPPWPHSEPDKEALGMPILGINEQNLKHLWLTDIMFKGGKYLYSASDGVVAKATARGRSVKEARNRVYRTVDEIKFQSKQFRSDIGERVNSDMNQLKTWGWI